MNRFRLCLPIVIASSLVTLTGCGALKEGLSKAVLMNYDQVNNFRQFEFATPLVWNNGPSEKGINGYYSGPPEVKGFWVTYLICDLRNEGSQAENFPLDLNKFYVVYQGKEFYHRPLEAGTFSSIPAGLPGHGSVVGPANTKFRLDTQVGPDTNTFQKNNYYPNVGYRFSIYVTASQPGALSIDAQLPLRYDGYPNVMNSRNQPAVVTPPGLNPAKKADLLTVCRPPA
jgi:hypothetical protein